MKGKQFFTLLLFLFVLTSGFKYRTNGLTPVKWILSKECSLKVNGSTNINKFSCVIPNYVKPDTLILSRDNASDAVRISGTMILDIQSFDCHNAIMTKDLRKTLKSEQYPKLSIKFISLTRYPLNTAGETEVKGAVTIELAGVSKRFDVDYKCIPDGAKNITLIGTKQVNFSDFNITPPRKLGGMIKTNNQLLVEFILKARILN
ncbi:YceI family protein [Pedobacter metabolipauper]|uniref:YceI-like domain-containing protein n=1 Tax=Pedobacter metabolipauper TaxID=425513 RepID=A0A4R6T1E0_9SPHI|nr:YceI family protein [Pedobacter metabolipauper]TDQ11438.1 YceI-like domain-containing protein [Pedobacter metabolipauper]